MTVPTSFNARISRAGNQQYCQSQAIAPTRATSELSEMTEMKLLDVEWWMRTKVSERQKKGFDTYPSICVANDNLENLQLKAFTLIRNIALHTAQPNQIQKEWPLSLPFSKHFHLRSMVASDSKDSSHSFMCELNWNRFLCASSSIERMNTKDILFFVWTHGLRWLPPQPSNYVSFAWVQFI